MAAGAPTLVCPSCATELTGRATCHDCGVPLVPLEALRVTGASAAGPPFERLTALVDPFERGPLVALLESRRIEVRHLAPSRASTRSWAGLGRGDAGALLVPRDRLAEARDIVDQFRAEQILVAEEPELEEHGDATPGPLRFPERTFGARLFRGVMLLPAWGVLTGLVARTLVGFFDGGVTTGGLVALGGLGVVLTWIHGLAFEHRVVEVHEGAVTERFFNPFSAGWRRRQLGDTGRIVIRPVLPRRPLPGPRHRADLRVEIETPTGVVRLASHGPRRDRVEAEAKRVAERLGLEVDRDVMRFSTDGMEVRIDRFAGDAVVLEGAGSELTVRYYPRLTAIDIAEERGEHRVVARAPQGLLPLETHGDDLEGSRKGAERIAGTLRLPVGERVRERE